MKKIDSIKKATLINMVAKYSNVLFNLLATSILARILSPEDYGVVAVVTVFTTFFTLFSDMGLGTGVIQNKELDKKDLDNIFSFTIYIGIILMLVFVCISYPISIVYNDSVYMPIGICLSFSLFFNALNMIPNALLQKEKQFITIACRTIVVALISYSVAIVLAIIGWRYYALVFQSIVSALLTFIWNFRGCHLKFRLKFDMNSVMKISNYSFYNFAYEILNYFGRNLDNLLTGKLMGPQALGYYNKAYSLMLYPVNYLTYAITPVLHPILSEHQDDKEYIYTKYLSIFKVLSLLGVFISVCCFFAAEEIVLILFGKQWTKSIPCIRVLSISIFFQMTSSSCTSIFKSIGDSKGRFKSGMIYVPIQIICILIGVQTKNIEGLAFWVAISFIFRFVIEYYFLIKRGFGISIIKFYKQLIPEIIIAIIICSVMYISNRIKVSNIILSAIYKGSICGITFLLALIFTKQYKYLLILLPKKIKQRFTK